jgi:hypothetical protein
MRPIALAAAVSLAACGGITFTLDQDLGAQKIEGSLLGGLLPGFLNSFPLTFDIKAETEKRNTGPASAVELQSFTLTASEGNFDFLQALDIFVSAPGQTEVKIASLPKLDKGATKIDMTIVPNVNMLAYVNAGATIRASASGTQPAKDVTFSGKVTILVRI